MLICLLHHLNYAHGLPDILPRPGDESEAFTLHACSSSSPNSVHIVLSVISQIIVDNSSDTLHIKPSGCHICCHQHRHRTLLERSQCFLSVILGSV